MCVESRLLLSIVVPSYNCASWLERAVVSALSLDNADLEIIIVDDGSTDETPALCQKLQLRHSCIKVIRQPNSGLSAARNTGIDAATGKFILLLDADDELMSFDASYLSAFEGDMLRIGVEEVGVDGKLKYWTEIEAGVSGSVYLQHRLTANSLYVPSWAYVYRRSFLYQNGLRFVTGLIHEDMLFTIEALLRATCVQATSALLYRYFRRPGSLTHQHSREAVVRRVNSLAKIARSVIDLSNRNPEVDLWLWARHVTDYAWTFAEASSARNVGWTVFRMEWMLLVRYRLWGLYRTRQSERWRLRKRFTQLISLGTDGSNA
jgi:glycosyltransferase involved in cell wall biosynthesis